jgi:hypothetical protein
MENASRKISFVLAIVALVIAALAAKPAYRAVRSWRAESLAAEAESAIGRQSWSEASQKAQAAYHLDPRDPRAIRVIARLYTIAGQPSAVDFWKNLRATGKATMEDRRELIRAGLRFGKASEVRPEVFALATNPPVLPENLRAAVEFFLLSGEKTNAVHFSRELVKSSPEPPSELLLGEALLTTRETNDVTQGRAILEKLSARTNSVGLEAQIALARAGWLSNEAAPQLIDRLTKFPLANAQQRLLADDLRLRLHPTQLDALADALVRDYGNAPLTNRLAVAHWLNLHKEFARTLELLPVDYARTNRDAFLSRIDALPPLGKWKEARAELEAENLSLEPVLRELYLARTARELKLLPEAEAHWRKVELELATTPQAMLYVAEYAEKIGELDEAQKVYERLTAVPEYSDRAFTGLIRLAERAGGTRTLREIMRDLAARRPDDPAPQNDLAYLNLLLNERVQASKESAEKLLAAHPNVMAYRTTLALANLRLDDAASALKLYDGLNLDWKKLRPGWQAVHAAVIGAVGDVQQARALAKEIPQGGLKPEERALIQQWL